MIATFSSPHDILGGSRGNRGIVFVGTVGARLLFEISWIESLSVRVVAR